VTFLSNDHAIALVQRCQADVFTYEMHLTRTFPGSRPPG